MEKNIPEINIGVVGHIDHGKTTLLSKLTGKFTDTHSEELKRGITIKLGYANMTIYKCKNKLSNTNEKGCVPIKYVSFVDSPGHEMLMATMLSGAAIIDAAILVIAANEGIKPQTKEHLMALQAKKIDKLIIVQNKIDLVSKEKAIEDYKEIKEFTKKTLGLNPKIIPISAQQGVNIDKLIEAINEIEIPTRDTNSPPLFLVARSFDINRPGKKIAELNGGVLGGILKKGKLKIGDIIEIKPGLSKKKGDQFQYKELVTKILSLHKGEEKKDIVRPGASISIETSLDPYLTKSDSLSGSVVSIKGELGEISHQIKLKVHLFKQITGTENEKVVEKLKINELLMLSVNTTTTIGTIEKISENIIELSLKIPILGIKKENVGIARNINSHWRLIGWGEIIQ